MLLENAKFDRRKHIYENDQFAELKRRAHRRMKRNEDSLERVRAAGFSRRKIELGLDLLRELNGRGVVRLAEKVELPENGVYMLYCTAMRGNYEHYGREFNHDCYDQPIYVGTTFMDGDGSLRATGMNGQMAYWRKHISEVHGLAVSDFAYRFATCCEETAKTLYDIATVCYQPEWNAKWCGVGGVYEMLPM